MKLSISVPDSMWSQVYEEGDSPSELVQTALAKLVEDRQSSSEPFSRAPDGLNPLGRAATQDGNEHEVPAVETTIDRWARESNELRAEGYRCGLLLAETMDWDLVESLPTDRSLLYWGLGDPQKAREYEMPRLVPVAKHLREIAKDFALEPAVPRNIEEMNDPRSQFSVSFLDAVIDALFDVRDEARARMRSGEDGGREQGNA